MLAVCVLSHPFSLCAASKVTLDKVTTYVTLVVNKGIKERAEAAEYVAARKRGEIVTEPSATERVRQCGITVSCNCLLVFAPHCK